MPGRPIPPPTATVAIGVNVRLAHWESDYIVQRRQPDGSWRTICIVERDEATGRTLAQNRAAMRAVRDRLIARTLSITDHVRGEVVAWDGTDLAKG